ncbi:stress-activated map kinase interacting protein 1-domain-containing protein [Infundibulicybe gibba]|nr:stress-activated map kinase interacting protein 1-domain-containing protein [Infundibulicybe gibba]
MSLITDTNYLIHSLRLSYLRDVEDPYGPRVLTLDPSYNSNPYILAASLADVERWPELAAPASPQASDDEGDRPSGFPGARLKHTQTIMGGRTGGLGLRVNAKRASVSKRMSGTPRQLDVKNFISANAPVQDALSTTAQVSRSLSALPTESWDNIPDGGENSAPSSVQPNVEIQAATVIEEAPAAKVVQFIPKFKGAAEMEARRRVRMAARRGGAPPPPPPNLDFSSSDEDAGMPIDDSSSDDEFEMVTGRVDSMDEGDEFDPEFAATRPGINSDHASEVLSVSSHDTSSISNSLGPVSPSHTNTRSRARLSPVSEGSHAATRSTDRRMDSYFEVPQPTTANRSEDPPEPNQTKKSDSARSRRPTNPLTPATPSSTPSSNLTFTRKKVAPLRPLKSTLSSMLASSGGSTNPFAEMYAAISGRGESASTNVQVFFPHAKQPAGKPMDLNVRRDATVEEVIGFSLWTYWEEGWLPRLDDGLSGEDDPKWATKLSAIGWILRIAEDGEVDDDFPPPDRIGKIAKFNSDAYAVLEATPAQIQQNQILESKIQRRPSRTSAAKKPEKLTVPGPSAPVGPGSAVSHTTLGSVPLSTSLGPSSSHGPQMFLRIRVDTADAVHVSTTIPVSAGMYMQEALELVCRRKMMNPKDYALLLADKSIIIPLDRTVASLQGKRELLLAHRNMLPQIAGDALRDAGRTTDPNASIFKRMSETPEVQLSSALDYTAAYKKYTIYRKMPMLVARQERTLAIDGDYIHIMPKAKAVFDSGKTSSYHIKSIAHCQQSTKMSSIFKLVLNRGGGNKRYDFEQIAPNWPTSLERSETINKSRRSRQVA